MIHNDGKIILNDSFWNISDNVKILKSHLLSYENVYNKKGL